MTPVKSSAPDTSSSQAVRAQLQLREMILAGELPSGERVGEVAIVEKLGISRTPIRAALMRLEQEGLLEVLPHGGYAVRSFSERDVMEAIELRGTLEGLVARLAAERGVPAPLLDDAAASLDTIDTVLARPALDDESFSHYVAANQAFHALLREMAGSGLLARELDRVVQMPFASPSGFVVLQAHTPQARDMFIVAQEQHRAVLDAIRRREGARAEGIMREHARIAQRNLREAVKHQHLGKLPGVGLIRPATLSSA